MWGVSGLWALIDTVVGSTANILGYFMFGPQWGTITGGPMKVVWFFCILAWAGYVFSIVAWPAVGAVWAAYATVVGALRWLTRQPAVVVPAAPAAANAPALEFIGGGGRGERGHHRLVAGNQGGSGRWKLEPCGTV